MIRFIGGYLYQRKRWVVIATFFVVWCCITIVWTTGANAQVLTVADTGIQDAAASGLGGGSITIIIARILRAFFALLGITAVGFFVYAGALWMTAGGDSKKVETAKDIMKNATIGMAIMLSAFGIVQFILNALLEGTTGTGGGSGLAGAGNPPGFIGGAALGQSIEYVLPEPQAIDVFRNTSIIVQFKKELIPSSFLTNVTDATTSNPKGTLNTNVVKIFKTTTGESSAFTANDVAVDVRVLDDTVAGLPRKRTLLTISLKNNGLFGLSTESVPYTVKLGPQIQTLNEALIPQPLFISASGYEWNFTVGTKVDLEPPIITSVYPAKDSQKNYRNAHVIVNFNKPMMPSTILAKTYLSAFVLNGANIAGVWTISNMAKTAEFRTDKECGKSICGDIFYCFEPSISVQITAIPATIDTVAGAPKGVSQSGLMSITQNSLDGDGDGIAEGPAVGTILNDTRQWAFGVGTAIDIDSPIIETIDPSLTNKNNVAPTLPISGRFNEILLPSTISNVRFDQPTGLEQYYYPFASILDASNALVSSVSVNPVKTMITLFHAPFIESTTTTIYSFKPAFTEGVLDAQSNCYVPSAGPSCDYSNKDVSNPYCCDGAKALLGTVCADKYKTIQ